MSDARIITADGELQASETLAQEVMAEHPAALQLRLLQTVVEVAAERNSTLVLPFPVELLRFLERVTPPERARTENHSSVEQRTDLVDGPIVPAKPMATAARLPEQALPRAERGPLGSMPGLAAEPSPRRQRPIDGDE